MSRHFTVGGIEIGMSINIFSSVYVVYRDCNCLKVIIPLNQPHIRQIYRPVLRLSSISNTPII